MKTAIALLCLGPVWRVGNCWKVGLTPRYVLLTFRNGVHEKHRSAWGKKRYFRAGGRGSPMVMPHPLSGCHFKAEYLIGLSSEVSFDSVPSTFWTQRFSCIRYQILLILLKVRQNRNDFFKLTIPQKKWTDEFTFTTMIPQVDLFSFVFWKKLEDTKKTFRN